MSDAQPDSFVFPTGRWQPSARPMGIGCMIPISERHTFGATPRFRDMVELCQTAEAVGVDTIWVPDHLVVRWEKDNWAPRGVWEGWTMLAGLAAATTSINLGVLVTCVGWRNPSIVAKMAESVDEISDGRFILGVGAGWHQPEYDMYGLPWDHRVGRFEDAINIIAPLLRDGKVDYQGRFFQAYDAVNAPRGPRAAEGGPPILVGTKGPRMMRLAARFADAWNSDWLSNPPDILPMLAALDEACREVGRDPATMLRSASSNIAMPGYLGVRPDPMTGTNEEIAARVRQFREMGIRHWVAGLDPCTPRSIEQFGRIMELIG